MRYVIIGASQAGIHLATLLSEENNDVTLIDDRSEDLRWVEGRLDVMTIKGSGYSSKILHSAGIDKTDFCIAVTQSDEVNMICSLTAKRLGAKQTIARIRDPDYSAELIQLKEKLEVDIVINPDEIAADEIVRLYTFSAAESMEHFADGKVRMVRFTVDEEASIVDETLTSLQLNMRYSAIVAAVVRGGMAVVPSGDFQIKKDDQIYLIGQKEGLARFFSEIGKKSYKIKNVMIIGGGRLTVYLSRLLIRMGTAVKVIEIDKQRCYTLSEQLPQALIIHGDGTDEELLEEENIGGTDGFIALTRSDEINLISSLLAKRAGVKKIVSRSFYTNVSSEVLEELDFESIVNPNIAMANRILSYARGKNIRSFSRLIGDTIEIIEMEAQKGASYIGIELKDLKIPDGVIILFLIRKGKVIIPTGNSVIESNDSLLMITHTAFTSELKRVLKLDEF